MDSTISLKLNQPKVSFQILESQLRMHLAKLSKSRVYIKGELQNEEVKDITFLIPKHTKATVSTKHDMHVIFEEIISPPTSFEVIA